MVAPARRLTLAGFAPLVLLGVTLLGGTLRVFQIANKGLWLDEAFSVWLGRQSLEQMWAWLLRIDQHPPLYYTLLHCWMYLGDSAGTVRLLSALLGTLTIPIIYFLGRRLLGRLAGLLAALILAVSPFHVRFAQETRMYTLLTFTASLAMLALVYLLTDPRSARTPIGSGLRHFRRGNRQTELAWLAYILFTAATTLTHNSGILFPLATNLFVFGFILSYPSLGPVRARARNLLPVILNGLTAQYRLRQDGTMPALPEGSSGAQFLSNGSTAGDAKVILPLPARLGPPSLRNWLLAQLGVLLLWLPWLPGFVSQARGVYAEFWLPRPTIGTVIATVGAFLSDMLPRCPAWLDASWAGFALLALLGIMALRRRPAALGLLLTLIATPIAGEWLVSLVRPIFYDRTLIWASIPLYLLLAAGLARLRYRPGVLAGLALLVVVNGLSLNQYYAHFEKEQWREAAAYVSQQAQDGDMLLFNAGWVQIPFDFYYRYYDRPLAEHGVPVDLFDRGILEPKMTSADVPRLQELVQGRRRVWLVYSHDWYTDPQHLIPSTLGQAMRLLETRQYYGLQLQLYGSP